MDQKMEAMKIDGSERNCWKPAARPLKTNDDDDDIIGSSKTPAAALDITHSILAVRFRV